MFTSAGRSLALRALSSAAPSTAARIAPVTLRALPIRTAPVARSFTVSSWNQSTATEGEKKKKKPAAKKKKAAPKKKKVAKKPLTPEQKEKNEIRDLKTRALLNGPSLLPETSWAVYLAENPASGESTLVEKVKQLSTSFKTISDLELNRLKNIAASNKDANQDTRRDWVESFPPEVIYTANLARRRLAKKLDKSRVYVIHDERLPKRTGNAYTAFVKSRYSNSGGSPTENFKAVAQEWKDLSEHEKSQYKDAAATSSAEIGAAMKELRVKGEAYWKAKKAEAKAAKKSS